MPKPHHSEAPADLQRSWLRWRHDTRLDAASGPISVAAIGVLRWIRAVYAREYDVRPSDVPTPAMKQLEAFKGSDVDLAALRTQLALELQYERACLREAHSRRAWAAAPSEQELSVQRRAENEKAAAEQRLERRTTEIEQAAEGKRLAGVRAKAREQAQKELEQ